MNQIQEKDWAEESWHGHTGMDSSSDYCITADEIGEGLKDESETTVDKKGADRVLKNSSPSS